MSLRVSVVSLVRSVPLPNPVRAAGRALVHPGRRSDDLQNLRLWAQLRSGRLPALTGPCTAEHDLGPALVASIGYSVLTAEVGILRCLELAGYAPVVLGRAGTWPASLARALRHGFVDWADHLPASGAEHQRIVDSAGAFDRRDGLLNCMYRGARVGRFAASTAMRELRTGELRTPSAAVERELRLRLDRSLRFTDAMVSILDSVRPTLAVFVDRSYTPQGELFDLCMERGIPGVTWNVGHRSNTLVLKRYRRDTRDVHPVSLSARSWDRARRMPWTPDHDARLGAELHAPYAAGDWYGVVGTQFGRPMRSAEEIRSALSLDEDRKVAVIFPHIIWDGTFCWGTDLFRNYEEWLAETVRAAAENDRVQWVVNIHPANQFKDRADGRVGLSADEQVVRRTLGRIPNNFHVIPPVTPISTYSLYAVADYALTVRGTPGIEAATFGIPVLTAGTGRYDRLGFTVDHDRPGDYLDSVARIQEIPRLAPDQRLLARRYAYGLFVLRPLDLEAMTLAFRQNAPASIESRIRARDPEDWNASPDVAALVAWFRGGDEDLLNPDPLAADEPSPSSRAPRSVLA